MLRNIIFFHLGEGPIFTVVDTPGFGDSEGHETENTLINEMMNVLKNTIKGANALVLLLNGEQERFDYAFQQTIRYDSVILCCCSYLHYENS